MANTLRKGVRTKDLTEDTSGLSSHAKQFVLPNVRYDTEMLAHATTEYDNPSLAILLSGNSDKKSKEYKAAIRAIQIWKQKGTKPGAKYQRKIIDVLNKNNTLPDVYLVEAANRQSGSTTVSISGWIQISNSPPEYRTMKATLSGEALQNFLSASIEGNQQEALDTFASASKYPQFSLYSGQGVTTSVQFSR